MARSDTTLQNSSSSIEGKSTGPSGTVAGWSKTASHPPPKADEKDDDDDDDDDDDVNEGYWIM